MVRTKHLTNTKVHLFIAGPWSVPWIMFTCNHCRNVKEGIIVGKSKCANSLFASMFTGAAAFATDATVYVSHALTYRAVLWYRFWLFIRLRRLGIRVGGFDDLESLYSEI